MRRRFYNKMYAIGSFIFQAQWSRHARGSEQRVDPDMFPGAALRLGCVSKPRPFAISKHNLSSTCFSLRAHCWADARVSKAVLRFGIGQARLLGVDARVSHALCAVGLGTQVQVVLVWVCAPDWVDARVSQDRCKSGTQVQWYLHGCIGLRAYLGGCRHVAGWPLFCVLALRIFSIFVRPIPTI